MKRLPPAQFEFAAAASVFTLAAETAPDGDRLAAEAAATAVARADAARRQCPLFPEPETETETQTTN